VATYKQIQNYIKNKHSFLIKTCWIAHVKEICGLNPSIAHNRKSKSEREHPCPPNKIKYIKEALKYFEMI
jgi:hypothetical protein